MIRRRHGAPCDSSAPLRPQPTPARGSARWLATYRGQCSHSTSAKSKLAFEHVLQEPLLHFSSAAFADLGHMKVDKRRGQAGVSEIGAHLPDGHPVLEQVGRETMAQSIPTILTN